jgi:hypothetical protein
MIMTQLSSQSGAIVIVVRGHAHVEDDEVGPFGGDCLPG